MPSTAVESATPFFAIMDTLPALPWWAWGGFFLFISAMLALDLGVFQREAHEVKVKEALGWCAVWVTLALSFNGLIWWWRGAAAGQEFLAAYLIELSLSVDNVFVFILVFTSFKVAPRYQHRVLFWGIIGAVVMRAVFILVGVSVIARFHWILYLFGAFLIYTGIKMALPSRKEVDVNPEHSFAVKLFRRFFPVSERPHEGHFFVRENREEESGEITVNARVTGGQQTASAARHKRRAAVNAAARQMNRSTTVATSLFVVLIVIETSDLVFALDSLPAVLAITRDGFIALTSNIFAILGLRSLYFALSGVMQLFRYLKIGLALVLCFIGVKMLIELFEIHIGIGTSLGVIATVLSTAIVASLLIPEPKD